MMIKFRDIWRLQLLSVSLLLGCYGKSSDQKPPSNYVNPLFNRPYTLNYPNDSAYAEFVEGLSFVHDRIEKESQSAEFDHFSDIDFHAYFKVFDKLSVAPNWNLESHYFPLGGGGRPFLFAFNRRDFDGDRLYKEFKVAGDPNNPDGFHSNFIDELWEYERTVDPMQAIEVVDDPMGYFQFIVFHMIGDNYCLFWHSQYAEMEIITSRKQLLELTKRENDFYYKFSKTKDRNETSKPEPGVINLTNFGAMSIEEVLQIDPTPMVTLGKDSAEVTIVTLGPWDGFISRSFQISRSYPHKIKYLKSDTLVPYHCGIRF